MFFECRSNVPGCSPQFETVKEYFLSGKVLQARNLLLESRGKIRWETPEDALLCGDIARACGNILQFYAIIRLARRRWPESRRLKIAWAVVLSSRAFTLRSLAVLMELFDNAPEAEKGLLASQLAATYARGGFQSSAAAWVEKALACGQGDDAKFFYSLSYAFYCIRDWEKSVDYGYRALQLAPNWSRLRLFLADALLAIGQYEKAAALVDDCIAAGYRDASIEFLKAIQSFAAGDIPGAKTLLSEFRENWHFSKDYHWHQYFLAHALWNCGEYEQAQEIARNSGIKKLQDQFSAVSPGQDLKIIPTRMISQEPNLCVPTSVAMVAFAQGIQFNPRELYVRMKGMGGTYIWRMAEEMSAAGFEVRSIRATHEAVQGMLQYGIPLIGEIEGVFNNHVEVISGYDKVLKVYYVRDPMHWSIGLMSFDELAARYAMTGNALIALISPAKQSTVQVKPEWISGPGESLIHFAAACAKGNVEEAERLIAHIPQDSVAFFSCANFGRGITLAPMEYQNIMDRFARDPEAPPVCRIRALLNTASHDRIDELIEFVKEQEEELGLWTRKYLQLLSLVLKGLWQQVIELADTLLDRSASFDLLWTYKAEAYLELGKPALANEMLAKALDISPDSRRILDRIRFINRKMLSFREKLAELQQALEHSPDDHHLKEDLAVLLLDGDDGLEYEKCELDYQRYFPKLPYSYQRLANWYLRQERESLADRILKQARALIGEQELPRYDFEKDSQQAPSVDTGTDTDKAALFRKAQQAIFAEIYQHPHDLPAIQKLLALQESGQLTWQEFNQLLALRLSGFLRARRYASTPEVKEGVAALLPGELPGATLLTLDQFLHRYNIMELPRLAAVAFLEWFLNICGARELSPHLQFNLGVLKELCNDLTGAEEIYRALSNGYPSYHAPQYRMAEILTRRGDYRKAIEAHRAAVAAMPGLEGSLSSLAQLNSYLGNEDEALFYLGKICKCFPYSFYHLQRLLIATLNLKDMPAAIHELEMNHGHYEPEVLEVFKTYLFLCGGEYKQAQQIGAFMPGVPELRLFHASNRLDAALHEKDYRAADELLDELLAEWPEDSWLHWKKAGRISDRSPREAQDYLANLFGKGIVSQELVRLFFQLCEDRLEKVYNIIQNAEEIRRSPLVNIFYNCFQEPALFSRKMEFLSWLNDHLPELHDYREELAINLLMMGKTEEGQNIAESLYKEDPDNPRWLSLMARCFLDDRPRKALEYLEKAYQLTGSLDYLGEIGGCYQNLKEVDKAKDCYWQVLDRSPYHPYVLTNLFVCGERSQKFQEIFFQAVEQGIGQEQQMFHVAAVEIARRLKASLPPEWIDNAIARYQRVVQEGLGYPKEKEYLGQLISIWLAAVGKKAEARQYHQGFLTKLKVLYHCGKKWIPEIK